jgi:hypothetical protein
MPVIFTAGRFAADDDAGAPLVGGLLYTYASGTTTPKATYTSAALSTPNTNPVVLDARGEAQVWLGVGQYTMVLKTPAGVTITTTDGIEDQTTEIDQMQADIDALETDVEGLTADLSQLEADLQSQTVGKGAAKIGVEGIPDCENVQEALDLLVESGAFDAAEIPPRDVPAVITGVAGNQSGPYIQLALLNTFPTYGRPIVLMKLATDRILIRVPVVNGGPQDFTEFEMFDWSDWMTGANPIPGTPDITYAWALRGIRAWIGGRDSRFLNQPLNDGGVSTTEFAIEMGAIADGYIPEGNPSNTYQRIGYGHGGLSDPSPVALQVTVDGIAGNLASLSVGQVVEGCNVVFTQKHRLHLVAGSRAGEAIGTVDVNHIFDTRGLTVIHNHTITASGIGVNNSYMGMMPMTGCDRMKAKGLTTVNLNTRDGAQVGNWVGTDLYAAWDSQNPTALLEFSLPTGNVGGPTFDDSLNTTSKSFALNNANWLSKFYRNWISGASSIAMPTTHVHQFNISVRRGLPE